MPKTPDGVEYTEYAPDGEGPRLRLGHDASENTRVFDLKWGREGHHIDVLRSLVGYPTYRVARDTANVERAFIERKIPVPDPQYFVTGKKGAAIRQQSLWCVAVNNMEGVKLLGTDPAGVGDYKPPLYNTARANLTFRSLPYDIATDNEILAAVPDDVTKILGGKPNEAQMLGDFDWTRTRYITLLRKPAGRIVTLRMGMMRTVGTPIFGDATPLLVKIFGPGAAGSQALPEGLPVNEYRESIVITHFDVPAKAYPTKSILQACGALNDREFAGFPPETLRLENVDPHPVQSPFGERLLHAQFRLSFAPNIDFTPNPGAALGGHDPPSPEWDASKWVADNFGKPRGHNWVLFYDNKKGVINYVLVSSDGTDTGTRSYRKFDFRRLFIPDQPDGSPPI